MLHFSDIAGASFKKIIPTFCFLMVLGYFGFHAVSGERGLLALLQLSKRVNELQVELDIVRAEKLALKHRSDRLKEESLDLDLLDEQARSLLGYAGQNELIYHYK